MIQVTKPQFQLGKFVATPGVLKALEEARQSPWQFLSRHVQGDWGCLSEEDKQANEEALLFGGRLLSAYETANGVKLWLITEADRSSSCLLLPTEY